MAAADIDPRRTALLLVSVQNDFVKGQGPPHKVSKERMAMIQSCVKVLKRAHLAGIPVIFAKTERRTDGSDVQPIPEGASYKPKLLGVEATHGADIIDELVPEPQDYLFPFRRISAFYGTPLEIYLRTRRVDTLLIGGKSTDGAVEGTVRDAWLRDYLTAVLSDCCDSDDREGHEYALRKVFPWRGLVMTSDEAMGALERAQGRS